MAPGSTGDLPRHLHQIPGSDLAAAHGDAAGHQNSGPTIDDAIPTGTRGEQALEKAIPLAPEHRGEAVGDVGLRMGNGEVAHATSAKAPITTVLTGSLMVS